MDYDFLSIEPRWQTFWEQEKTFRARDFEDKPTYYILDMFPYPSGAGLHIGHPEGYTASDILARYKMARGFNVLHPMGWDAFGLPTEQYAVQTGTHPADTTRNNVARFIEQLKQLGFGFDWDREINTTDPDYYRWTQWIFLQLFKHGLAYVDEKPVWWCPALGTVLANEEIIDGRSERGNHPVERRNLRQWVLRITAYADKLLDGLADLDWPDSTKRLQANWIGRSEGAEVHFGLPSLANERLTVFTTRPDTLYGVTFMVMAPEHPLVARLTTPEQLAEVNAYIEKARAKSDLDRTDLAKEKSGVFTGAFAINPVNGRQVPIWIADYVLMGYGTGAIMAVPGHDERDYAFASQFNIPIVKVIEKNHDERNGGLVKLPYIGEGVLVHSDSHTGLPHRDAAQAITADLEARGLGKKAISFRLRDWLFSRQRYWGEPFPVLWVDRSDYERLLALENSALRANLPAEPVTFRHDGHERCAVPLPDDQLPLRLPEVDSYQPTGTGDSPLANATDWINVRLNLLTGETAPHTDPRTQSGDWVDASRESNTMPQWAGSCWYYLRYLDPRNSDTLLDPKIEAYWGMPDFYIGGAEHAVLHLLYARFWHRFLHDIGVLKAPEPFRKLFHQGIILGEDGEKMSKSRGNVVNPETIIAQYGADTLRLYLMFLGPLEAMKPWNTQGIEGVHRFLKKTWRECVGPDGGLSPKLDDQPEDPAILKALHETIRKVTEDTENLRFNTAISQMMIFINQAAKAPRINTSTLRTFVILLAPYAPHLGEELWSRLGGEGSVSGQPWPSFDPALLVEDIVKIMVQINGKLRGELLVAADTPAAELITLAKAQDKVVPHLEGKTIIKEIVVPGKIVNLVIK